MADQQNKLGSAGLTTQDLQNPLSFIANTGAEKEREKRFQQLRQERERDIQLGQKRAQEIAPEGVLGRLQGIDSAEAQALRETRLRALQRVQQQQQRQLAGTQARGGVTGGLAGQQQINLANQQLQQQQAAQQALLSEQSRIQRGINQFNLGQAGKEFAARQAIGLGEAGLGAAERGAVLSQLSAEAGAAATRAASGGGKK